MTSIYWSFSNDDCPDENTMTGASSTGGLVMSTAQKANNSYSKSAFLSGPYAPNNRKLSVTLPSMSSFTVEAWIYLDINAGCTFNNHNVNNTQGFGFNNGASVTFNGNNFATPTMTLHTNCFRSWHHFAYSKDASTGTVYVFEDGVSIGTMAGSYLSMGTLFQLGLIRSQGTPFQGYVNDLTVSNYAKYTSNFTAPVRSAPLLRVSGVIQHCTSYNASDGAITDITISQGYGNYSTEWTTTSSSSVTPGTASKEGLQRGSYTLTVTDGSLKKQYTFYVSSAPAITAAITKSTGSNGAVTTTIVGGDDRFGKSYSWSSNLASNISTAASISSLAYGTYTITVADPIFTSTATFVVPGLKAGIVSYNDASGLAVLGEIKVYGFTSTAEATWIVPAGATALSGLGPHFNISVIGTYSVTVKDGSTTVGSTSYTVVTPMTLSLPFSTSTTATTVNTLGCTIASTASIDSSKKITGDYGGSLRATSTTTYVSITTIPTLTSWTYAMWAYIPSNSQIAMHASNSNQGPQVTSSVINCNGDGYATTSIPLTTSPLNAWHHFAVVRDQAASVCRFYIDGKQVAPTTVFASSFMALGTSMWLGRQRSGYGGFSTAYVNDFTLYNYARYGADDFVTGYMLSVSIVATVRHCSSYGGADGYVDAFATGGTAPYTYNRTLASLQNVQAGSYSLTATDASGRTATSTFAIYEPLSLSTSSTPSAASPSGSATVVAHGGTGVYSYVWKKNNTTISGATTATISSIGAGTYDVYVSSGSYVASATIAVEAANTEIAFTGGAVTNVLINGQSTGAIGAITATGGSGVYVSYTWSSSEGGTANLSSDANAHSELKAGTYSCLIMDSLGNTLTATFTVTQNPALTISGGAITNVLIYGQSTGAIGTVSVSGGSGSYVSYAWTSSPGATVISSQTLSSKTGLLSGVYTLTVTDSVSASAVRSFTVTQNAKLEISGGPITNVNVYGEASGSIGATSITGGSGSNSYLWTSAGGTAITSQTLSAKTLLKAANYTLTVTDTLTGEITSQVYRITQPLHARLSPGNCTAFDAKDGSITVLDIDGGVAPYSFKWSSPIGLLASTTASVSGLDASVYTVVIRDSSVYTLKMSVEVTEPQMQATASVGPIEAVITWPTSRDVSDVYQVSYALADSNVRTTVGITRTGTFTIIGLKPLTQYTLYINKVLKRATNKTKPFASIEITTTADTPENFDISRYLGTDGSATLQSAKLSTLQTNVADLFSTGQLVSVKTRTEPTTLAKTVRKNETLTASKFEAIVLPFTESGGADQEVDLQETTDNIGTTVVYNSSNATIKLGDDTTSYMPGSVARLGRYKISVCESQ